MRQRDGRRHGRAVRIVLALVGAALLLTGCSAAPLYPSPDFTVQGLFLYLRRGDMESAWQEIGPALQASNRSVPTVAPDGEPATAVHWTSVTAFRREAPEELAPFLRGAALTQSVDGYAAHVVARAALPSHARAYFALMRVDNEWVIQRLVIRP